MLPSPVGACPLPDAEPLMVNGMHLADRLARASCGCGIRAVDAAIRSAAEALGYTIAILPEKPGDEPPAELVDLLGVNRMTATLCAGRSRLCAWTRMGGAAFAGRRHALPAPALRRRGRCSGDRTRRSNASRCARLASRCPTADEIGDPGRGAPAVRSAAAVAAAGRRAVPFRRAAGFRAAGLPARAAADGASACQSCGC